MRGGDRHRFSHDADFNDGFGESRGRLLRQIMADASRDEMMLVSARELFSVRTGLGVRCAIGIAFEGESGRGSVGDCRDVFGEIVIFRCAIREAEPPAVIVDYNRDMVWIVESCCAAIER